MEAQSATTLRDVLRNVPGITIQAGEGGTPAGDQMAIRGFSARTDIFIDGVRDFGGYSRDCFNLEQVEVTKGPASATSGRGSTGGSVNMISKAPSLQASRVGVCSSGGSADYKRGTLDRESADQRARVARALRAQRDVAGRRHAGPRRRREHTLGHRAVDRLRARARRRGSPPATSGCSRTAFPTTACPGCPATNVPLAEYANQAPPVDFSNFYGMRNRDYEKTTTDLGTVVVSHDVGTALTLRNQVRYGVTSARLDDHGAAVRQQHQHRHPPHRLEVARSDRHHRGESARRHGPVPDRRDRPHALVTGVELSREVDENRTRIETGPAAPEHRSLQSRRPTIRTSAASRQRRVDERHRAIGRRLRVRHGQARRALGADRAAPAGTRSASDYDSIAATGVNTPFERTDRHGQLARRRGVQAEARTAASTPARARRSIRPPKGSR